MTRRASSLRGRGHGFLLPLLAASLSCAGPSGDPDIRFADHDEASTATIEHGAWGEILDEYLHTDDPSGVHLFDYAGLQANPVDRGKLQSYLAALQEVDPRRYRRDEQMAYWINFYNALTVEVVLTEYPVDSIRDISSSLIPLRGPWGDPYARLLGQELTLDNIEHDILRPIWQDPRIHYAVNCASIGCPNLAPRPYTADRLEEMLEESARGYVNHPRGVEILDESFGVASSIYSWFVEDFGGNEEGVIRHLLEYANPELDEAIRGFEGGLEYEYDWNLNAAH